MVGCTAPILLAALVGAETVVAGRQGQRHRARDVRRAVVASVGGIVEGVDRQVRLRVAITVLDRHHDWNRRRHCGGRAARQRAVIGLAAPELGAVPIAAEAIVALRMTLG